MGSVDKRVCPSCGRSINSREIALFNDMVNALWRVVMWCVDNNTHEFTRKDIKHLLHGDNEVARFGDWVFFGGLVYKRGKGQYGLNKDRVKAFFAKKLEIPIRVKKTPGVDGDITVIERGYIGDIPMIQSFLDSEGYRVVYHG